MDMLKFEVQSVTKTKTGVTVTALSADKGNAINLKDNKMSLEPGDILILTKDVSGTPFLPLKIPSDLEKAEPCSDCPDSPPSSH